jgi:hypothetical protein
MTDMVRMEVPAIAALRPAAGVPARPPDREGAPGGWRQLPPGWRFHVPPGESARRWARWTARAHAGRGGYAEREVANDIVAIEAPGGGPGKQVG